MTTQTQSQTRSCQTPARSHTVASLLASLQQYDIADAAQRQRLAELAPSAAWIVCLQTLAAWLAALLMTGAFAFGTLASRSQWPFGVVLIAVAMGLFWRWRTATFPNQLALALSLAGQGLVAFGLDALDYEQGRLVSLVLAVALSLPRTTLLHRVSCLLAAIGAAYSLVSASSVALMVTGLAGVTVAVALWLSRRHWAGWPQAGYWVALAHSSTVTGLVMLLAQAESGTYRSFGLSGHHIANYRVLVLGTVLLWLACVAWLVRELPERERRWLTVAAVLVAALGYGAPGMLACLALMLATFHACQRTWVAVTLVGAVAFLGIFYYSLHQSLLMKSATLAGIGVLLLVLGAWARRWQRSTS